MPFITQEGRLKVIDPIFKIIDTIHEYGMEKNSTLAYIFYKLGVKLYGVNWNDMEDFCKILASVSAEYRRNIIVPYEIQKIKENGDVY